MKPKPKRAKLLPEKTAVETLEECMFLGRNLARLVQSKDEMMFLEWTKVALAAAIALAPYQSLRLEAKRDKIYTTLGALSPEEIRQCLGPRRKARRKK
jgi:hypothetical protein